MRGVFGVLSLLVVLGAVGFLAKKQLSHTTPPVTAPGITTPQQAQLPVDQQVKQSVDALMQQPRPMPDDK